jgi:hypothetical protein
MSTLELKELSHPAGEVIKIAAGKTLDLKSQGSVTMPSGSVLQVLLVEDSSAMAVSTDTYTDTNLSLTITPSSTSSKILAFWNVQAGLTQATSGWGTRLVRESTNIFTSPTLYAQYANDEPAQRHSADYKHLDSPNTTSAITYKVQVATYNSRSVNFNDAGNQTQLVLMEIQG